MLPSQNNGVFLNSTPKLLPSKLHNVIPKAETITISSWNNNDVVGQPPALKKVTLTRKSPRSIQNETTGVDKKTHLWMIS